MKSRTKSNNMKRRGFVKDGFWNEIMRGQRWSMLVLSLLMFLIYPVQLFITIGNMVDRGRTEEYIISAIGELFVMVDPTAFTLVGTMILAFSIVLGGIAGVVAFSYLHNSSQVGLYHSLPISRNKILWTKFTTATVSFMIPLILGNVANGLILFTRGYTSKLYVVSAMILFFYNIIMFWIGYLVVAIAMLLTGRIFVGICGAVVISFYMPAVYLLILGYTENLYYTLPYMAPQNWFLIGSLWKFSPIMIMQLIVWNQARWVFFTLLLVLVLWMTQHGLMKIRPSEVAGRPMAYKKLGEVIKVLLAIIFANASALFFYGIANSYMAWLYFGGVFGVIVGYILLQLMYGVTFRDLFKQKKQVLFILAAVILLIMIPERDLLGVDTYLPDYEKIENLNMEFQVTQSYYGQNMLEEGEYDAQMGKDEETYALVESIIASAKTVNQNNASWEEVIDVYVEYELTNGQVIVRSYDCYLADIVDALPALWENEEFLNIAYPVRVQDPETVVSVEFYNSYNMDIPSYTDIFTDEQRLEFMEMYQKDALAVDGTSILEENPIAIGYYWSNTSLEKIYYASGTLLVIYPSYTNTIAYMEEIGYELPEYYQADEVEYIRRYMVDEDEYYDYYDEEEIEAWLPLIYNASMLSIFTNTENATEVTVELKNGSGRTAYIL